MAHRTVRAEEDEVSVSFAPPPGYYLEGWLEDVPAEVDASTTEWTTTMTADLVVRASLRSYAPTPGELADNFQLNLASLLTDQLGQPLEVNGTGPSYSAAFALDDNSTAEQATGAFSVARASGLDLDDDDSPDALRGDFIVSVLEELALSVTLRNLQVQTADGGAWADFKGGGFTMTLGIGGLDKANHSGEYSILFNDGTSEQGQWTSSDIRATAPNVTFLP